MLKGQLWATTDINLVNHGLTNGFKIVFLGDPISLDPLYKDVFVLASSLTPDYNTMALKVDGDERGFAQMYTASLNTKAAVEMLAVIFVCLYKGTNIMFYVPQEANGLDYIQYLLAFINKNYGIQTQTKSTQFGFDVNYLPRIIELMYLHNLITPQEFLVNMPSLDDLAIRKLVDDLHPMVNNPTDINEIVAWFSNYKDALTSTGNMNLINGVMYG